MQKLGLLAGAGRLPVAFSRAAGALGYELITIAVVPESDPELAECAGVYHAIGAGSLTRIISVLQEAGVKQVTMLGKVTKELLFTGGMELDAAMRTLLSSLPNQQDDTIMLALVKVLMQSGLQVVDQTTLIRPLLVEPGVLTQRPPTPAEEADMEYGFLLAKEMGRLDIGQTVVVKNKAVMAIEAIEGTNACIVRGGELSGGQAVVVKTAKPSQDQRFDMPTIGPATIEAMIAARASALCLEAGRVLVVDKPLVVKMAAEKNITIVAR